MLLDFTALAQPIQQRPWRTAFAVLVFLVVQYFFTASAALFWGLLVLSLLYNWPAQPFLTTALIALVLAPILYWLDRPSQAERVGVLVFALLALGATVNLGNTWRQKRASVSTLQQTNGAKENLQPRKF